MRVKTSKKVGNAIKKERLKRNEDIRDFAEAKRISWSTLYYIEAGILDHDPIYINAFQLTLQGLPVSVTEKVAKIIKNDLDRSNIELTKTLCNRKGIDLDGLNGFLREGKLDFQIARTVIKTMKMLGEDK